MQPPFHRVRPESGPASRRPDEDDVGDTYKYCFMDQDALYGAVRRAILPRSRGASLLNFVFVLNLGPRIRFGNGNLASLLNISGFDAVYFHAALIRKPSFNQGSINSVWNESQLPCQLCVPASNGSDVEKTGRRSPRCKFTVPHQERTT